MNEMTMNGLTNACDSQWAQDSKYAAVAVTIPGNKGVEVIINSVENLKNKLAYWTNVYDENLVMKSNPEIKIVAYAFANTYAAIEQELVWLR